MTKKVKKMAFGGRALKSVAKPVAQPVAKPVGGLMGSVTGAIPRGLGPLNAPGAKPANFGTTGGLGAAILASNKGGASSASSGPMAKADPLRKIGSGPSRQAMMKKGGKVSSASKRGDGIATKGKTKGKMI